MNRRWQILVCSLLLTIAARPGQAAAQSCAMLSPGVPGEGPEASAETSRAASEAVAAQLSGQAITVIPAQEATRRMLGEPYAECHALDCGPNVVRSLGVDFVVLVTVWAPRGNPTSVVVAIIGEADSVAGDAPVETNDVIAATMSALQIARQRWQASQMGFISVASTPSGANVEIDGRIVGQTPLRHLVMSGQRQIRVLLDGHLPGEESVVVLATQEHRVELTLVEGEAVTVPDEPAVAEEASILNYLIGGGLSALGVGLLIPPIHGLAVDGTCVDEVPCSQVHQFGVTNGVLFAVGFASLATGVVFLAAQPIRVGVSASSDSARVDFSGTF